MYSVVRGIYENGVLTLLEPAPNEGRAEVLVTFMADKEPKVTKKRIPGGLLRLAHLEGKTMSIPDDFNESVDHLFDL